MKLFSFSTSKSKPNKAVEKNKGRRSHGSPSHRTASPGTVPRRPAALSLSSASSSYCSDLSLSLSPPARVTMSQLERALMCLGGEESDLAAILAAAGPDKNGQIGLDQLSFPAFAVDEEEEELKAAFGVFDANGDGKISAEELREALAVLGDEGCSIDDCRRIIGVVDSDGDGFVGFRDFARMMAMQCP